jgi:hypothetical protein
MDLRIYGSRVRWGYFVRPIGRGVGTRLIHGGHGDAQSWWRVLAYGDDWTGAGVITPLQRAGTGSVGAARCRASLDARPEPRRDLAFADLLLGCRVLPIPAEQLPFSRCSTRAHTEGKRPGFISLGRNAPVTGQGRGCLM